MYRALFHCSGEGGDERCLFGIASDFEELTYYAHGRVSASLPLGLECNPYPLAGVPQQPGYKKLVQAWSGREGIVCEV